MDSASMSGVARYMATTARNMTRISARRKAMRHHLITYKYPITVYTYQIIKGGLTTSVLMACFMKCFPAKHRNVYAFICFK